ncbi:MAG: hypothetical protein J0M15_00255 [Deltaproteobacteria bacterium]|nr:hypothetical protein [Deltaproteobacteria bacterium]
MKKRIANNTGFLTIDFILSIIISFSLAVLFFVVAFTLSSIEVAQYIAYSVGRTYSAGHINISEQESLARKKMTQIMNKPGLGKLFKQGWFELGFDKPAFRSGYKGEIFNEYDSEPDGTKLIATGVRLLFKTNLFNMKLGFLGSTNPTDQSFTSKVTGFMLRNPTSDECQKFMSVGVRHKAIIELDLRYRDNDKSPGSNSKYLPMEDNGC